MKISGHAVILAAVLTACLGELTLISTVEVPFGDTVFLPCNSSGYGREELSVKWKTTSNDVAYFLDGHLVTGNGYEGRVDLLQSEPPEEDFSLILSNVVMSDTDTYKCLWQGKVAIAMVTLNVLPPPFTHGHTIIMEGEDVTLPCFGTMPKNTPWDKMYIQWLHNEKQVLLLESGKLSKHGDSGSQSLPSEEEISQGNFSLTIKSAGLLDQGVYKCLYKANDSEVPRTGHPKTYDLTVSEVLLFRDVTGTTTPLTGLAVDARTDLTTAQDALEVFQTSTQDDKMDSMEKAFGVSENTESSTSMFPTGLITHYREDSVTVEDSVRVISDLPPQSRVTTDLVGFIAGASADSTTEQNTIGVVSDLPPQPRITTETGGLIPDANADSSSQQDPLEVISEIPPQSSVTSDLVGLITGASTTEQNTMQVISQLAPQARVTTNLVGLTVDASGDSTTEQNADEVISDLPPQIRMTTDLVGLIADSTTDEDTVEVFQTFTHDDTMDLMEEAVGVTETTQSSTMISDLPPQVTMTTDLVGLIADSTTDEDTVEVFQMFTHDDTMDLMEEAVGVTETTQSSTMISDLPPQVTMTTDLVGLIADSTTDEDTVEVFQTFTHDDTMDLMEKAFVTETTKSSTSMLLTGLLTSHREDITTVEDSVRVISELPPQSRGTTDLVGFITTAIADSTTEQNTMEGGGYPSEVLVEEKVPWICIGIISGVILVTAVLLGTLVSLGRL